MSASQRTKGAAWERDVVRRMNEPGIELEAARNLSQTRDGGHDIDSLAGAGECKARAAIADYLLPREGVRWVAVKADRREPVLILRLDDGLRLLARELAALRAANQLEAEAAAIRTTIKIIKGPRKGPRGNVTTHLGDRQTGVLTQPGDDPCPDL